MKNKIVATKLLFILLSITFVVTVFCLINLFTSKKKEGFRSYAERQRARRREEERKAREFFEKGAREAEAAAQRARQEVEAAAQRARQAAEAAAQRARQEAERLAREAAAAAERAKQEAERIAREVAAAAQAALQKALGGISGEVNSLKSGFERIPAEFNNLGSKITGFGSNINSAIVRETTKINDGIKSLGGPMNQEFNNIDNGIKSIPGIFDKISINFKRLPEITINR